MNALPGAEWGAASRPYGGGPHSGDRGLITTFPQGFLTAVIDASGHGAEAEQVAVAAEASLRAHADLPVDDLMRECHRALSGSRGAAVSLAAFHERQGALSWVGVGNVATRLYRTGGTGKRTESLVIPGGVVGYRLPPLRVAWVSVSDSDVLVMTTDGVKTGVPLPRLGVVTVQELAEHLVYREASSDDALAFVVRFGRPG